MPTGQQVVGLFAQSRLVPLLAERRGRPRSQKSRAIRSLAQAARTARGRPKEMARSTNRCRNSEMNFVVIEPKPLARPELLKLLTPAERLVALHLADGLSNKETCSPSAPPGAGKSRTS